VIIRHVELFCGIGGFRLGLERASPVFKTVWANDIDKYACRVYRRHWNDGTLREGDVRQVDAGEIPDHELLTAGFPCQSFSVAGKRKGFEDTRGSLFFEIARIVEVKRPELLLLENVRGLLSNQGGHTFLRILQTLDDLGYDVEWQVLNSKHFGVPQNRERVFIIGHLRGTGSGEIFPITEGFEVAGEGAEGPEEPAVNCIDGNYWKGPDKHGQRTLIIDGHHRKLTREMGTLTGRENRKGTNWLVVADRTRTREGKGRNLESPKEYANSLTGVAKDNLILKAVSKGIMLLDGHPDGRPRTCLRAGRALDLAFDGVKTRRLTPVECERLQGFPDDWTRWGLDAGGKEATLSDTQRYKLLGNAVTVNVVEFLGRKLLKAWRCRPL
jgi:DNA (cytosine-5)-methyltransferase 1